MNGATPGRGSPPVEQDLPLQHRTWRLQRIGWVLLALLIIAALLGSFGGGPVSRARASDGELSVCFERFARSTTTDTVEVRVREPGATTTIWIDDSYLDRAHLLAVVPEPERVTAGSGRTAFTVRLTGEDPRVRFVLRREAAGWAAGRIGVEGGPTVGIEQLVYP